MADVFGDQFADNARDKIVALMEALKTTMVSDYDPTFSYVYDRHRVAKLRLNAVSVEIVESESTPQGIDDGPAVEWEMTVSCRIHTAYQGDPFDQRKTMRLAEGVANKLQLNLFLTDNYRIDRVVSIANEEEFAESLTIGAEVIAIMKFYVSYEQE